MLVLSNDSVLREAGAQSYSAGTGYYWYDWIDGNNGIPGHYDLSRVSEIKMEKVLENPTTGNNTDLLIVDIEAFNIAQFDFYCHQYVKACAFWRHHRPNRELGIYAQIPIAEYHALARNFRYLRQMKWNEWLKYQGGIEVWQSKNDKIVERLFPWVTCLIPRLYPIYSQTALPPGLLDDRDAEWRAYADGTLTEAKRLAKEKPIYPILTATYQSGKEAVPQDIWEMMVKFVATHRSQPKGIIHWDTGLEVENWRKPYLDLLLQK